MILYGSCQGHDSFLSFPVSSPRKQISTQSPILYLYFQPFVHNNYCFLFVLWERPIFFKADFLASERRNIFTMVRQGCWNNVSSWEECSFYGDLQSQPNIKTMARLMRGDVVSLQDPEEFLAPLGSKLCTFLVQHGLECAVEPLNRVVTLRVIGGSIQLLCAL